jgi:hypothetical protein
MTKIKLLLLAGTLTVCASTAAFAQAQPYCGSNPPAGDTYGVPFSGSAAARAGARACQDKEARHGSYGWRDGGDYYYRR